MKRTQTQFPHIEINEAGEVFNTKTNKQLKHSYHPESGYPRVGIYDNGQRKVLTVHRLLAMAFKIEGYDVPGLVVDHIDGDTRNSTLDNLQFITKGENRKKGKKGSTSKPFTDYERNQIIQAKRTGLVKSDSEAKVYFNTLWNRSTTRQTYGKVLRKAGL